MAPEVKNEKPPTASTPSKEGGREPIEIKSLTFKEQSVQLPNGENVKSIHAGRKPNRPAYDIDLLPWMRQYRVTYLVEKTRRNDKNEVEKYYAPEILFYVPESWAIGELAAQ